MSARIVHGDMLAILPVSTADYIDAVVTDPPYHLTSNKKGGSGAASLNLRSPAGRSRITTGFMGQTWDGGDIAFDPATWAAVYRVMKPGAHLVAFGGTRTQHRMACAIEDAGFEIRDTICWLYGSGFPKSHNLHGEWQGWGTALKPGYEPIIIARKPLIGTVAANVLAYGTGGLNIDACRIETAPGDYAGGGTNDTTGSGWGHGATARTQQHGAGRWPANVAHDGSDEVMAAFAAHGDRPGFSGGGRREGLSTSRNVLSSSIGNGNEVRTFNDTGTAARFYYCAKASKADRGGSKHPTVKPISLMSWLVRMVCPPGGTVLDPFAGSGTTLLAANQLQVHAIGIEQSAEYVADIERRLANVT